MTLSIRSALFLLVLPGLAACAEPRWLPVTGSNIQAAFFGNTVRGTDVAGGKWTMWIASDGKAVFRGSNADGTPLADAGTAKIDGDQLCVAWQKMHDQQPFCEVIYVDRTGQDYRAYTPELNLNANLVLAAGNADNL
jgi:hypothetical protein